MAAAAELFATHGYARASLSDLGEHVGISAGAIYRHFSGKDGVLEAVVLEGVDLFLELCDIPAEHTTPTARLSWLVSNTISTGLDHGHHLAVWAREAAALPPDAHQRVRPREQRLFSAWREAVGAAQPGLSREQTQVRQLMVSGGMVPVAVHPPSLARPRLDILLSHASLAAVTASPPPAALPPAAPRSPWSAPPSKRQSISAAALRRFRERGYEGVGIDEIGEAAGLNGPNVYRYFANKAEILLDAYDTANARLTVGAGLALAAADSPSEALDGLIRSYIAVACDDIDLIAVTSRETANLPAHDRRRLARRRNAFLETWSETLRAARPEMSDAEAQVLVRAVQGAMNETIKRTPSVDGDDLLGVVRAYLTAPLT